MKELIKEIISENIIAIILIVFVIGLALFAKIDPSKKEEKEYEKLKLRYEILHLQYQVGIDSLRYDLELNFYEKRK